MGSHADPKGPSLSLRLPALKPALKPSPPVHGSGPDGTIEISDIRAKLGEIRGEVDETTEAARPYALYAGVAAVVAVVAVAFVLGRRRGKRQSTWVEIRRL